MPKNETYYPQARQRSVVIQEVADEVLVYDLNRHEAHCLNQRAAQIWTSCDGETSVAEIARLMEQSDKTTVDESMVWLALDQLGQAKLLEEPAGRPMKSPGLTRREAIRKFGLVGAMALPLVTSVVAPTALMAATPGICAKVCRRAIAIGTATNCGDCATVPGTCYNSTDCNPAGLNFSSTCQACGALAWRPI